MVHPAFPGKDVPVRKKAPPSRKSEAIATHAAPWSEMATEPTEPNPTPKLFFPFTPTPFRGGGKATQLPGRGCGGPCFPLLIQGGVEGPRIVPSITCPEIPGRTKNNHRRDSRGRRDDWGE